MKTSKIQAELYSPKKNDTLIMDTNILIKILYPINYTNNFHVYEDIYSKAIQNNVKLIISSIQISEFINTCIRLQFNLYRNGQEMNFKQEYRNTDDADFENYSSKINIIIANKKLHISFAHAGQLTIQYDKFYVHTIGESENEVSSPEEQQHFLFD